MPQRHVFERGDDRAPDHAGEAVRFSVRMGFFLCGIEEEPFWPSEKDSRASPTSVRCKCRISVASRSTELATTPSVAKNAACRSRGTICVDTGSGSSPRALRDVGLDPGVDIGERAHRSRELARRHFAPRRLQPFPVALELGVETRELEAEGGRFGMDAVTATDAHRVLVLAGPALEDREQSVDVGDENVGGARELDGETGIEHVRGRHPLVHEPGGLADMFRDTGQEGDHVVARLLLDLVDPLDIESSALPCFPGRLPRDDAEIGLGLAGQDLDVEPDPVSGFGLPDRGHLRAGIAGDHRADTSFPSGVHPPGDAGTDRRPRREIQNSGTAGDRKAIVLVQDI